MKTARGESPLGILAGGGPLPAEAAAAARACGREVFLVGLEGHADPTLLIDWPHEVIRIGAVGRILRALRRHHCQDVLMIGPVRRPSLAELRPDLEGARILGRIGRAIFAGDDRLLSAIIRVLGEEGFQVIGIQDVLRAVLAPSGLLSLTEPDAQAMSDARRGLHVAAALGAADVGQGCVVQQGVVLAVEAVEGTDAMLARCAGLRRPGPGGVLVKRAKPGQERRADLPTIGARTVAAAAEAGLRGIVFEAGSILADREATIAAANAAGLFLLGLDLEAEKDALRGSEE